MRPERRCAGPERLAKTKLFVAVLLLGFLALGGAAVAALAPRDEALFKAIDRNDLKEVRELLRQGAHLDAVNSSGSWPSASPTGASGASGSPSRGHPGRPWSPWALTRV